MTDNREQQPQPQQQPQHSLEDWLKLHRLGAQQCREMLALPLPAEAESKVVGLSKLRAEKAGLGASEAWALARDALGNVFNEESLCLAQVHSSTQTLFDPDPEKFPRAFTLNDGGAGVPLVVCNYRGGIADILTLAHEFGHAVQLVASGANFVAPAPREICAFLSELALLEHLRTQNPALHVKAKGVWQGAVGNTWRNDRIDLLAALDAPDPQGCSYDYQWNYPVARLLAIRAFTSLPPQALWPLFEGKMDAADLVNLLTI